MSLMSASLKLPNACRNQYQSEASPASTRLFLSKSKHSPSTQGRVTEMMIPCSNCQNAYASQCRHEYEK